MWGLKHKYQGWYTGTCYTTHSFGPRERAVLFKSKGEAEARAASMPMSLFVGLEAKRVKLKKRVSRAS